MPPPAPPDLGAIPADANIKGTWSAVYQWPLMPIHAVLLPDGRLLTYGTQANGRQSAYFIYDVWSPAQGAGNGHTTLPNGTGVDTFCGSQILLPTSAGDVALAGGDIWNGTNTLNEGNNGSVTFTRSTNQLTAGPNMNRARWYATMTTLPNGQVYVQGGRGGYDRAEVRNTDGTFKLLSNLDTSLWDWYYPRNYLAPDGRIFGFDSYGRVYYVDPSGEGSGGQVASIPQENYGYDATSAMYAPGKILHFGGNSNGALIIDINGSSPVIKPTQSLSSQRRYGTATLLADGSVLATGGSAVRNELVDVSLQAEIWNPATGQWRIGASSAVPRLYHSMAILLPDASVLVGGGGSPGPLVNVNAETYYPPYLFTADGKLAPRPTITEAPALLSARQAFDVSFGNAASISKVALVKTGAATHNWNMDQRYVPLPFTADGTRLTVTLPTNPLETPPGHYLLFLMDDKGVPSMGRILRMQ